MYDHSMQDVKRIELLTGPQGTLYGRNSAGGVMEIRTIHPLDLTTQLIRGEVGYATANQGNAQASIYRVENKKSKDISNSFGWGIAARYRRTDGFYINEYTGKKIDGGQQAGGRVIMEGKPNDAWRIAGTVNADWVKQGAFPYASVATGKIAYNRPASYERLVVMPALQAIYEYNGYKLNLNASYQMLRDNMVMDQDYTTDDIFTLNQKQQQHNATLDALLSNRITNFKSQISNLS
jgi:outer membrane receptor protein involved in Fe transport